MTEVNDVQAEVEQKVGDGEVEQITKEPPKRSGKEPKIKDPRKVAGGKALAERNKEARAAKAALEQKVEEDKKSFSDFVSNIQLAGSVVGAGFVLWHGWQVVQPLLKQEGTGKGKRERGERERGRRKRRKALRNKSSWIFDGLNFFFDK